MSEDRHVKQVMEGAVPPARPIERYGRVPPSRPASVLIEKGIVPPKPLTAPVAQPTAPQPSGSVQPPKPPASGRTK